MATRKNALEDISAASLVLHAPYFSSATKKNVVSKLLTNSAGHCIRYANIKVFSEPNFHVYG